ncbi:MULTISPECIES: hypothetical protein [unclassified Devosia]|uniref:hypothetical protein n=1 Tax=unclassified Devosia TaxID=196773 RepID=UPI00155500F6|nr:MULTISPECIES: hypothetical protein [unclassified Devosia]
MFLRSSISVLALTAALAASPASAQLLDADIGSGGVDISVGGDDGLNVGVGGGDGGLDAGVGLGGDNGINADVGLGGDTAVDADVDVGGDDGLGVDAEIGGDAAVDVGVEAGDSEMVSGTVLGGDGSPRANVLDTDVNVIQGAPVSADVNLGSGSRSGAAVDADVQIGAQQTATIDPTQTVNGGTRLLALGSPTARTEALIELIADPGLAEIDLDASIDDRRIALVRVDEVLSEAALAEIEIAIGDNPEGRADLLAVLEDSAVLSSVLEREGVALEDVLAIEVGADGLTEVLVRGAPEALVAEVDAAGIDVVDAELGAGSGELAADVAILPRDGQAGGEGAASGDLADLDIAALTEEELAALDLSLLPDEQQRVDAVLRILGTEGDASGAGGGEITILDLDALLGEAAQADVLATLGGSGDDETLAEVEANLALTQALADAGIAPEAVVAVRAGRAGQVRLLVDTQAQLADSGDGAAGGVTGAGGSAPADEAGSDGAGDGADGTGDDASGDAGGPDTDNGSAAPDDAGGANNGATGGGASGDVDTAGSDGSSDGATGARDQAGALPGGVPLAATASAQVLTAEVEAFALPLRTVGCSGAAEAVAAGDAAEPADVLAAGSGDASLVLLEGCGSAGLPIPAAEELRNAVAANEALGAALAQSGVGPVDVVTVTQGDTGLTLFVVDPN